MFPVPYPTYPKLEVYFYYNTPVVVGEPFKIKVAYYSPNGAIDDLQSDPTVTYMVINGEADLLFPAINTIEATQAGSYRIRYFYTDLTTQIQYAYDFLFCAVVDIDLVLGADQIYKCIKREEPEEVYSQNTSKDDLLWVDNTAVSNVVDKAYVYLNEQTSNIFPEDLDVSITSYVQSWLYMVTGQYDFYDPTTPNLPALIQFIRNCGYGGSPFELAFWVSKYIWLRTNNSVYVYISENIYTQGNFWRLGISELGINTTLAGAFTPTQRSTATIHIFNSLLTPVPELVRDEIRFLLDHWGVAGIIYDVVYDENPATYGLTWYLGGTYNGDTRTVGIVCIAYALNSARSVIGITNPYNPRNLVNLIITPSTGALGVGSTVTFTVTANFTYGWSLNVTNSPSTLWYNATPSLWEVTTPPDIFTGLAPGMATVKVTYESITVAANIQIYHPQTNFWKLGLSNLGVDTILAPHPSLIVSDDYLNAINTELKSPATVTKAKLAKSPKPKKNKK